MSKVARTTVLVVGGVLLLFVLAVMTMLESLERRVHPDCLDRVAEAPDGAFAEVSTVIREAGVRDVHYRDGLDLWVPSDPKRIASALPGITEMIAYLGAADRLVAISPWCDVPAGAKDPRRVSVQPFDAEGFIAAAPDLVIVDRRLHLRDLAAIRKHVPRVLLLETSRSLAHLRHSMQMLAVVLGDVDGLVAFDERYQSLLASIDADWPGGAPRVFLAGGWDPLYALGPGSLLDDMLRICGATNIACDLGTDASGTFSEELVLAREPAWILSTTSQPMPERLRTRWARVPAVRDGQVAPAHVDDIVRGGPRILDALERLHEVLRGRRPPADLAAMK